MDNNELYDSIYGEHTKLVGIGGWLLVLASWNITATLSILSALSNLSQRKMASKILRDYAVPDNYFEISKLGYMILLPLSILLIIAFFKKKKFYIYLEIFNLIFRIGFIVVLGYLLEDKNIIMSPLVDNLSYSIGFSMCAIVYLLFSRRVKRTFVN